MPTAPINPFRKPSLGASWGLDALTGRPARQPTSHALEGRASGPLYRNSWFKVGRITDGMSKAVFLGEHSSCLSDKAWAGTVPGAVSYPSAAFIAAVGTEPDDADTLVLVHSGPEAYASYGELITLAEAGKWQGAEMLAIRFRRDPSS